MIDALIRPIWSSVASATLPPMKIRPSLALLAFAIAACSKDAANPPSASTDADAVVAAAAPIADRMLRARIGMVFTDTDPWMAGAVVERGTLRVGDHAILLASNASSIPVTITAIRDDATQTDVAEATAPQGVFLSFRPASTKATLDAGSEAVLVGDQSSNTRSATP